MPPKKMKTVNLSSIKMLKKNITMPVIFAYIVSVVLIYNTYGYLTELENCECFDKSNVDIKFLKYYELVIGILGTCILFLNLFIYFYPNNKKVGGGPVMDRLKANGGLRISNIIILSVLLFLHFLIASNAYDLYNNILNDCECSNQWEQYYLYLQGTGSSIYIGSFILRVLLVLSILIFL